MEVYEANLKKVSATWIMTYCSEGLGATAEPGQNSARFLPSCLRQSLAPDACVYCSPVKVKSNPLPSDHPVCSFPGVCASLWSCCFKKKFYLNTYVGMTVNSCTPDVQLLLPGTLVVLFNTFHTNLHPTSQQYNPYLLHHRAIHSPRVSQLQPSPSPRGWRLNYQ